MSPTRSYHTRQREMVLQFFAAHPAECFCARQLIDQKQIPVGTATLYRALALLTQEGHLKKFAQADGGPAFYQYNESDACRSHFHLKCLRCGRLVHMDCSLMKDLQDHIAADHDFWVDSGKSILYGICKTCRG